MVSENVPVRDLPAHRQTLKEGKVVRAKEGTLSWEKMKWASCNAKTSFTVDMLARKRETHREVRGERESRHLHPN